MAGVCPAYAGIDFRCTGVLCGWVVVVARPGRDAMLECRNCFKRPGECRTTGFKRTVPDGRLQDGQHPSTGLSRRQGSQGLKRRDMQCQALFVCPGRRLLSGAAASRPPDRRVLSGPSRDDSNCRTRVQTTECSSRISGRGYGWSVRAGHEMPARSVQPASAVT